jgi:hypothetical protein
MADNDSDLGEARVLRPLQVAASRDRIAFGPRAGQKVLTVQGATPRKTGVDKALCTDIEGFSLHAAGQLALKLKTPWCDGITHLVIAPLEFMQGLAALV